MYPAGPIRSSQNSAKNIQAIVSPRDTRAAIANAGAAEPKEKAPGQFSRGLFKSANPVLRAIEQNTIRFLFAGLGDRPIEELIVHDVDLKERRPVHDLPTDKRLR